MRLGTNSFNCTHQEKKCDSVVDCDDGSDENGCEFLVVDDNYVKEQLPLVDVQDGPVKVERRLHCSVLRIKLFRCREAKALHML